MKPRVLVISRDSWNDTNNSGITLSNLFQNWESNKIANLYCRDEIPNNKICTNYFKISESVLVNKILGKTDVAGFMFQRKMGENNFNESTAALKNEKSEKKLYDFFRKNRWYVFLWVRELLWKIGKWKSNELKKYLEDFNPDIIYSMSYDSFYMHNILEYVKMNTNAKVVYFHCDDLVTYRQYSLSPFYWINRFWLRKKMDRSIKSADKNYCIIDEQSRIYKNIYNIDFDLLYKTGNFLEPPNKLKANKPLKIVYAGNIIYGRIKSIIDIANALEKLNKYGLKAKLFLYTVNLISKDIKLKLESTGSVELMGKVPYNQIPNILSKSDVLVHVESLEKQQMLATSLSFSTKLVDYFEAAKPILAMGWEKAASIKYLKDNGIGMIATNANEVYKVLNELLNNPDLSFSLGLKAWQFGQTHHNKNVILRNFENDLIKMMKASNN